MTLEMTHRTEFSKRMTYEAKQNVLFICYDNKLCYTSFTILSLI